MCPLRAAPSPEEEGTAGWTCQVSLLDVPVKWGTCSPSEGQRTQSGKERPGITPRELPLRGRKRESASDSALSFRILFQTSSHWSFQYIGSYRNIISMVICIVCRLFSHFSTIQFQVLFSGFPGWQQYRESFPFWLYSFRYSRTVHQPVMGIISLCVMWIHFHLFCFTDWLGLSWLHFHLFLTVPVLNFSAWKFLDHSRSCAHLAYSLSFRWHNTTQRKLFSVNDLFVINIFQLKN